MIASLDQLKLADPDFIKEQESFEKERNIEEEELRITELREIEETKKKDSIDLDLFYPSPYYSSILCKTKVFNYYNLV